MTLAITSTAFAHNESIPKKYTCQGEDINPPFDIVGIPEGCKSLVLIHDDPDAPMGIWDHWIMWNIKPIDHIEEHSVPERAIQGTNSWGRRDYGGPCPPDGEHRYFFKLYALDVELDLTEGDKAAVMQAIERHILEETELIGLYCKS